MPEYVEKIRVAVRVSRPGEPVIEGELSLDPGSLHHDGPQTLLDLLNAPAHLLPSQRRGDDATLLLSSADLQWVMALPAVAPELVRHPVRFDREERLRVRVRGGDEIEGLLQMELKQGFNRASDYLNEPEPFFALATRQGTFLIQKSSVREIVLFDSSPVPIPLPKAA
jgi:hypothetical protein